MTQNWEVGTDGESGTVLIPSFIPQLSRRRTLYGACFINVPFTNLLPTCLLTLGKKTSRKFLPVSFVPPSLLMTSTVLTSVAVSSFLSSSQRLDTGLPGNTG